MWGILIFVGVFFSLFAVDIESSLLLIVSSAVWSYALGALQAEVFSLRRALKENNWW